MAPLERPGLLVPEGRSSEVVIETLERITDEGQAHLGALFLLRRRGRILASGSLCGLEQRRIVRLVDLVRGEVGRVDV
jgi:hypothetical protein